MDDMRVGDSFNLDGQQYEYMDYFETEIPSRTVLIYELRTKCPDCGAAFWTTASARQVRHRHLRRRCDNCRKPGAPVQINPKSK
jgi:predicted RNA-binding Zn-ribbon protein involved in translation (DUF1610 family)